MAAHAGAIEQTRTSITDINSRPALPRANRHGRKRLKKTS
jgi:hypothetical protein